RSSGGRLPLGRELFGPAVVGLARRRAHDLVDDHHRARHLVAGDVVTTVRGELVERGRRAGPELHDRTDVLAPTRVGDADDRRVARRGVALQRGLDLFGEHLLAAGVDALATAAQHRDRAVGLDDRLVAGHRPAFAGRLDERRRGLVLILPVAQGHVAAAG